VAETNQENLDFSAGENISGLGSREASEELGSMGETGEVPLTPVTESEQEPPEPVSQTSVHQPPVSKTNEFTHILAGIMAAIQQTQDSVRLEISSVKEELAANNESVRAEICSMRADLATNNERLQESVKNEIDKFRKQMQTENEAVINKFENQSKQTKSEFSRKLEAESRRLTNLVSQGQRETESELLGFKSQLQTVSSDFEEKLIQACSNTQSLIEELANHVDERQSEMNNKLQELGREMNNQFERQKEGNNQTVLEQKLEQVNAKIVALASKVSEPRPAVVIEPLPNEHNLPDPSVVHQCDLQQTGVQSDGNRTCSCQSNHGNECMSNHLNTCRMTVDDNQQVSSFLSSSELPLPQFNEAKDTNPVYHIRQLDEFMQFRGVPKALQLAVAYRSMIGQMSKQWAETASWNLKDYLEFRREFLKAWRSSSRQSLVKCRLYQGKYHRNSGLSLSAYFFAASHNSLVSRTKAFRYRNYRGSKVSLPNPDTTGNVIKPADFNR
jgi:hypothetical protein